MKHNIDYFRDEIRNGFYIPTAIKQSWANALDILSEIDRICKKYDISYYADWGSFLGAVRHGGFVPWDDDLDICMLRDDYDKFRKVADNELPPEFCIHDYEHHEDHWLFLSRVVSNSRINFDEAHLNSHYNFPWLSAVDIFIKDYLYNDPAKEKERCNEVLFILAVAEAVITQKIDSVTLLSNLDKLEKKYAIKFTSHEISRELAISLYALAEKQMAKVSKERSKEISQLFPWGLKGIPGEPKERYEKTEYLPFEDTLISVPACYNLSLHARYGDYNIIKKGVAGHDYPSFESQKKNFEIATGFKLPRFTFDAAFLNIHRDTANPEIPDNDEPITAPSDIRSKRQVLFLPIGPKEWKGFEQTYNKETSNPDTEVQIVPLPLIPKNCLGQISLTEEEINAAVHLEDYPDNLPIMNWAEYNLEQHQPDVIYIQSPYDAENPYLTLPPYYYAENLIFYTKELVYIPIGPVADFTKEDIPDQKVMDFYVTMPGVILADKILLHSENLKSHYVDKLTAFTRDESTRSIWEHRISVISNLYMSSPQSPEDSLIKEYKHLLYCISSYEFFEHTSGFKSAIEKRMNILKDNADKLHVSVCIYPPVNCSVKVSNSVDDISKENAENTAIMNDFQSIVCELAATCGFHIVSFDIASIEKFVSGFDAYYGSSNPLVPVFVAQKKPVMISNYELDLF